MKKPILVILSGYALTFLAILAYFIYSFLSIQDNGSGILGLPFAIISFTGLAFFVESIIFAIIFYKKFATTWVILVPVFLLTSIIPIDVVLTWYSNRPVSIPQAGELSVSIENYKADGKLIIDDYLQTEIDSNNVDIDRDTILTASIDTIIYSLDKTRFFAIIIAVAKDNDKKKYCANYRVGRLVSDKWQIGEPKGNIWSTCFQSIESFKYELRQYYYKRYSINNSSNKPEIWMDNYIFNF